MGDNQDTAPANSRPAPEPARRPSVERHLVLVNHAGWQDINELYQIAAKVRWLDPTIGTFVVPAEIDDGVTYDAAGTLPSLVVSFGPLRRFQPKRGKVYQGRPTAKFEQLQRLDAAGVPVPMTTYLTPQAVFDPRQWGEFVVVKPSDLASSSHGKGVQLMRTERVRYQPPGDYPEGHPGRLGPMLVQRFIDTGRRLAFFRVLMLFDQPLYCQCTTSRIDRPPLSADDAAIEAAIITNQGLEAKDQMLTWIYDADVIEAARQAARAMPEIPLKGCDVIRDERTGRVYVLEVNPGGNTWHFSSAFLAEHRRENGAEFEQQRRAQFDALSAAAHVLAERTRREAE